MFVGIFKQFFLALFLLLISPVILPAQVVFININTAETTELQTLNGIGPAYAQRIIDYRNANGLFKKVEDIKNVSGIGEVTFSKIRDYIIVDEENSTTKSSSNVASTTPTIEPITSITTANQSSSSGSVSTHYSATPITNLKSVIKFEINAGRNRLGIVGAPLEFKAETIKNYLKNTEIKWSLGDGTVKYGEVITHSYEYPGNYIVIVNASSPEGHAVSRTNVEIIPSEISISYASPDRIEITNNSERNEVNLFGRALIFESRAFQFPQDTILATKQKINFSASITNLHPTRLNDVDIIVIGENIRRVDLITKIEELRLNKITSIRNEIAVLEQKRLALLPRLSPGEVSRPEIVETIKGNENNSSIRQTALVSDSVSQIESSKMRVWLETLRKFFFRVK